MFGITIPGETGLESSCISTAAGGILGILLESLDDPHRTALDAVNGGGCTFNSRIASVVLILENDDRRYVETFRLEPPSLKCQPSAPGGHRVREHRRTTPFGPLLAPGGRCHSRWRRGTTRLPKPRCDKAGGRPAGPRRVNRIPSASGRKTDIHHRPCPTTSRVVCRRTRGASTSETAQFQCGPPTSP